MTRQQRRAQEREQAKHPQRPQAVRSVPLFNLQGRHIGWYDQTTGLICTPSGQASLPYLMATHRRQRVPVRGKTLLMNKTHGQRLRAVDDLKGN